MPRTQKPRTQKPRRGRPPQPDAQHAYLHVRATRELLARSVAAATAAGLSHADFVRAAVEKACDFAESKKSA